MRNAGDLIFEMGWKKAEIKAPVVQPKLFIPLTRDEEKIMELLNTEGDLTIDEISRKSELPVNKAAVALLNLELENIVRCRPGKLYTISQSQVQSQPL